MLDRTLKNCDVVSSSNIGKKEDYLFLCNHIASCIKTNNKPNRLYINFVNTQLGESASKPTIDDIEGYKRHCGFPSYEGHLTDNERSALDQLNSLKTGEFFAIKSTDSNGKYKIIKSMVFNNYIYEALGDGPAPVIVYSGNDDSVKEILESFKSLERTDSDNILYKHWIENVNSTATYINDEYTGKEYQHITKDGKGFMTKIDNIKTIEENKNKFMYNCFLVFNQSFNDLTTCKDTLHSRLYQLEDTKKRLIETLVKLKEKGISLEYTTDLRKKLEDKIKSLKDEEDKLSSRLNEWKEYFDNLPKSFKFLMKKKIEERFNNFIKDDERDGITLDSSFEDVDRYYNNKITETQSRNKDLLNDEHLKLSIFELFDIFKKNGVDIEDRITSFELSEVNKVMDSTVRYHQIWYAIHYYECRWLMGEFSMKENFMHSITRDAINRRYRRLSMISPLLVMQFEDLPHNFYAYVSEDRPISPIHDFIDLLILDNAEGMQAGIGANAFYLAKQAVVIGTEEKEDDCLLKVAGQINLVNID